jgi:hypothetical protein
MSAYRSLLVSLVSGMLVIGCVNLTKPMLVQECANAPGGCTPNWVPPDAADATAGQPDLRSGDEPAVVKHDVAPDNSPPPADGPADQIAPDTANKDVIGDTRPPSDPIVSTEPTPPPDDVKSDLPVEKTVGAEPGPEPQAGPEPGPEPGREPGAEPGPEPGKEPGVEPGPEPGPEPGKEPGPEPGPEPPPDAGSKAACANAIPITVGSAGAVGTGNFNTTSPYCFVTCDSILYGWGCDNFTEARRTVTVNGTSVTCGGALPAKKSGYYYFAIGAGGENWDAMHWSGTAAASCTAPAGGFTP